MKRRGAAILWSFCLAIALSSCGGISGSAAPPDHVKAVVLPFLSVVPFHIAAQEGYFAEQNLEVEFIRLGRDQEIMTSLARGEVDVATGMLTLGELTEMARGVQVRLIASLSRLAPDGCAFAAVVARRELVESGALNDAEQIRGLRFDANVLIPHGYWLEQLLRPLGVKLDELAMSDLPPPASIAALIGGATDVSVLSEPHLSMILESAEVGIWQRVDEIVPGYAFSVVKYGPTILEQRREVGERFAVAMLKAIRQFNLGKTPRNLELAASFTGLSRAQVEAACWAPTTDDARIDPSVFRGYQEWNVKRGLLDRVLADDELFDRRFIDHANAVLDR
ncbi:MAG: ABC transporter substrate-binding protein [Acidobacteriota bacterium]